MDFVNHISNVFPKDVKSTVVLSYTDLLKIVKNIFTFLTQKVLYAIFFFFFFFFFFFRNSGPLIQRLVVCLVASIRMLV